MISGMVQASVSVKRIDKYMNSSELNANVITKINTVLKNGEIPKEELSKENTIADHNSAIKMTDASFGWSTDDQKICLENVSLDIPKGSLIAVVGQVGSGKSSLLSAILGEMEPILYEEKPKTDVHSSKTEVNGSIIVEGSIAYAAQQAWIQNASLKNNILFSKTMDENRYNQVVKACALEADLEILSAGDETEIGEKGINL